MKMKIVNQKLNIYSIKNFHKPPLFKKNKLIKICWENLKYKRQGYNWPIIDENHWFSLLYDKFFDFSMKKFNFTPDEKLSRRCWCYGSTQTNYSSYWHDHKLTSTINSVYYLSIPSKTSISFLDEQTQILFPYFPEENELIIFPNDLKHKPNNFCGKGSRISINMEIIAKESSDLLFNRIK
jgi:hypothetical protein